MDQSPLVDAMIDAGHRFAVEFDKVFPVAVAFWLKDRDETSWNLHIASSNIGDRDRQRAFEEIVRITREMKDPLLGTIDIRLRKMDDRIVRFAVDFQMRYSGRLPTVFNVPSFEGVEVDGMYLYPPMKSAAA